MSEQIDTGELRCPRCGAVEVEPDMLARNLFTSFIQFTCGRYVADGVWHERNRR